MHITKIEKGLILLRISTALLLISFGLSTILASIKLGLRISISPKLILLFLVITLGIGIKMAVKSHKLLKKWKRKGDFSLRRNRQRRKVILRCQKVIYQMIYIYILFTKGVIFFYGECTFPGINQGKDCALKCFFPPEGGIINNWVIVHPIVSFYTYIFMLVTLTVLGICCLGKACGSEK